MMLSASSLNQPVSNASQMHKDEIKNIDRTQLRDFLKSLNGRFVSVDFVKQDGSPRTLLGRLNVTYCLKGGENKVEAVDRPYLTVWDRVVREYRTVNLATVSALRAERHTYVVA